MPSYRVSAARLDVRLSVTCGQVFRWDERGDGSLFGVDGDTWFHVQGGEGEYFVESNNGPERFHELFQLDRDFESMEAEVLRLGPELAPYAASLAGLRLLKPQDAVEETFCFLCTPNNNLTRILGMVRVLAGFGEPMADRRARLFPSLEVLAGIDPQTLRAAKFGYRAETVPAVAAQILDRGGRPWLEGLRQVPYADAHQALVGLKGVGPKLADCIALFALHHTEAVPVDTHLWQAAVRHYFPEFAGKPLTDARYRQVGDHFRDRFGCLAGWAHQYLFYDNLLRWRDRKLTQ